MSRLQIAVTAIAVLLLAPAAGRSATRGPAVPLGHVRGEFVNFETPLIKPLLVTADGRHVVAINEPDGRLVVRETGTLALVAEIRAGQGLAAIGERPGAPEIWVTAMLSSAVIVIDSREWKVTHALHPEVGAEVGLRDTAAPGGIAFSADGAKAWVTATATDSLLVYDAQSKLHVDTVPLTVRHNGRATRVKEPRSVVRVGDRVYVAPYKSGNQTGIMPIEIAGVPTEIWNVRSQDGFSLPDADVVALSAIDETILFHQRELGNLITGLAIHPATGELLVASMEAQNGKFLGERAFPRGQVTLNQLTLVTPEDEPEHYTRVSLDDLPVEDTPPSIAMPTDIAVDNAGRIYVAGYASAAIGVLDASGSFLGILPSDDGPRGLAVSPDGATLYCLNRIAGTLTAYDVSGDLPTEPFDTVPIGLYDPTWDRVRSGRLLFHDASNSGAGSTGCFSCHADLGTDGLAWDLSAYHDLGDGFTQDDPPLFWKDRKFVLITQDCRSLGDSAPYHWRGERDLQAFNSAFTEILKGSLLPADDFALLEDYVFSAVYPPNPFQPTDRSLRVDAVRGSEVFVTPFGAGEGTCNDCHTLPIGSRGSINLTTVIGGDRVAPQHLVTLDAAQLRGLWFKESDATDVAAGPSTMLLPVTGFGLNHTGSTRNLDAFFEQQFTNLPPADRASLTVLIRELDTGVAPAAATASMLSQQTLDDFRGETLVARAAAGDCDVAVAGQADLGAGSEPVGATYDPALDVFRLDDSLQGTMTLAALTELAAQGKAELLFLGVPPGSGERIGIDRDRDGLLDGDENREGTDPADPDFDDDGFWDSYDDDPLVFSETVSETDPPLVTNLEVRLVTASSIHLTWDTDTFSPTRVLYGLTPDFDQEAGEQVPLPPGSNHWKRRHSLIVRGLDDGTTYHMQVQTLGQNGVEGSSEELEATTLSDDIPAVPATVRIRDLGLAAEDLGSSWRISATMTVTTNHAEPVAGAEVRGVWTLFQNGEPFDQFEAEVVLTDDLGVAVVELEVADTDGVDKVDFAVPMYHGDPADAVAGVVDPTERLFSWPDSTTSAEIVIPEGVQRRRLGPPEVDRRVGSAPRSPRGPRGHRSE